MAVFSTTHKTLFTAVVVIAYLSAFQVSGSISTSSAYSTWVTNHGSEYTQNRFVGNKEEVAVHWRIDGDTLHLAAAVQANGWVGFGIASSGGMLGSDIVVYTAADNALIDSYALMDGKPLEDTCQDWTLIRSTVEDGFIVFEASRLLSTGDSQDHPIVNDEDLSLPSHRIIAAWGDSEELSYHFENRTSGFLRFFAEQEEDHSDVGVEMPQQQQQQQQEEIKQVEVRAGNFTIPEVETTYQDFCFSTSDLLDDPNATVHITAMDFLKDARTTEYVHHLILYAGETDDDCDMTFKMVFLWAPGSEPLILPQNVGFALGQEGFQTLRLEIHYDNRKGAIGIVDNSGVRLKYTTTLREHEAGVLSFGDVTGALFGTDVGRGFTRYDFFCPASCTETHFATVAGGNVTVFQEMLHMHETGARMVSTLVRNGQPVHEGGIDYYDFEAAGGIAVVQQPFQIAPGDAFQTTCYYKEEGLRRFGPGSKDEMCITFMLYYPRIKTFYDFCGIGVSNFTQDPSCEATMEMRFLEGEEEVGRTFGLPGEECVGEVVTPSSSRISDNSSGMMRNVVWSSFVVATVVLSLLC